MEPHDTEKGLLAKHGILPTISTVALLRLTEQITGVLATLSNYGQFPTPLIEKHKDLVSVLADRQRE